MASSAGGQGRVVAEPRHDLNYGTVWCVCGVCVVWCGVVWCGVVWCVCGAVRCGVGVVWCGVHINQSYVVAAPRHADCPSCPHCARHARDRGQLWRCLSVSA